jgi:hypothetical protein
MHDEIRSCGECLFAIRPQGLASDRPAWSFALLQLLPANLEARADIGLSMKGVERSKSRRLPDKIT